jgi:hypothetical protein
MVIESPPRRRAQDDPQALIPEARERQRRRWLAVVATVALSAAVALGTYSLFASSGRVSPGAGGPRGLTRSDCRLGKFAVKEIPISGAGSLYRFGLQLTNQGSACRVGGYPGIRFSDAKGTIPFLFRYLGKPRLVTVPERHSIFSILGQARCDLGGVRTTAKTSLALPNDPRATTFTSPLGGPSICKPGIPTEGRIVTLTPFQSLRAAYQVSLNYAAGNQ